MRSISKIKNIVDKYCTGENKIANLITIYIAEAHPIDEWYIDGMPSIAQHKSIQDRQNAANSFASDLESIDFSSENGHIIVIDSMENVVKEAYEGWPERLYVLHKGEICYKGGVGPWGYEPNEVTNWLEEHIQNTQSTQNT